MVADRKVSVSYTVTTSELQPEDLMGAAVEIADVCDIHKVAWIEALHILDSDSQGAELDVLLFRSDPGSLGTVGEPLSLSQAQVAMLVGIVSVGALNYSVLGTPQRATVNLPSMMIVDNGTSIWVVCKARFRSTYTSGAIKIELDINTAQEQQ
jgi:hypothetical protein